MITAESPLTIMPPASYDLVTGECVMDVTALCIPVPLTLGDVAANDSCVNNPFMVAVGH